MNVNMNTILLLILVALSQVGCLPNAADSRPLIDQLDGGVVDGEGVVGCDNFYDTLNYTCVDSCPEMSYETDATSSSDLKKINTYLNEDIYSLDLEDEEIELVTKNVNASRYVCLKVERPNEQITIHGGICACKDGVSDILNDCDSYCSEKTVSTDAILYGKVELDAELATHKDFGNLENWCNNTIDDGLVSPSCRLEATDNDGGKSYISVTIPEDSNTFTANIGTLAFDKTYILRLVERGSGSNASTKAVQIRRIQRSDDLPVPSGPLEIMPINQYTCYNRSLSTNTTTGDYLITGLIYQHFYYPSNEEPQPLAAGTNNMICHDVNEYGSDDSPLYPRLMNLPGHFSLWDKSDARFFDQDQNGVRDIEDLMKKKIQDQYNESITITNIFRGFPWATSPNTQSNLGYYMTTWSDPTTGKVFCPTQDDYNGSDPVFKVMKELIGVDTEAIYVSIKEPETIYDDEGNAIETGNVYLLIRENLLKKIWFYYENGQHYTPDETTAKKKTIRFYWPADTENPYIKKSSQRIYTIIDPSSTVSSASSDDGTTILTTVPPPDKRFGCVPSSGD